jgi:hypothetical protein
MAGFTHASPATIFGAILIHIAANNKIFYFLFATRNKKIKTKTIIFMTL